MPETAGTPAVSGTRGCRGANVARMALVVTSLRRLLWLVLLSAAGGAVYGYWRDRQAADELDAPAWPPITPDGDDSASVASSSADSTATIAPTTTADSADAAGTASFVNSLVDAPEARSADGAAGGWVEPLDDGSCPISHPIKANDNSGIFHVPDGRFYERTKAERCYANADAATADGYRQAKN